MFIVHSVALTFFKFLGQAWAMPFRQLLKCQKNQLKIQTLGKHSIPNAKILVMPHDPIPVDQISSQLAQRAYQKCVVCG